MLLITVAAAGFLFQAQTETQVDWRAELESGRQAYAKRDYAAAVGRLQVAAEAAAAAEGNDSGLIETLRLLAAVHRDTGDYTLAEPVLQKAAERCAALEQDSVLLAAVLEETAIVQRAQGHAEQALATIDKAVRLRELHPEPARTDLARDVTMAAMLRSKLGDQDKAIEGLERAIKEWDRLSGDPQSLAAIEELATAYRDRTRYAEAEPLIVRALRLREAANGPEGAEVISTVDSLAYIEFGLRKFADAEPLYQRLLALWEKHGGPEHPMTALTLDKMAEFYAFQQRYEEAEKCAVRALAARTGMHIASLNQTGRVLLMEAKLEEAEDLYDRTVQIGDLARRPTTCSTRCCGSTPRSSGR